MKKILYSVFALAVAAFTFTGCEDVPAPYDTPQGGQGGQDLPEGVYLDQNFTSSLGDFSSVSESGTLEWYNDFKSAMCTGYQDFDGDGKKENQAGVTWLVSKEIDLTEAEKAYVTINHAINYERGDINENNAVLISKDFTGDVTTATWKQLVYNTDGLNSSFDFVEASMNIPADYVGGKIVIALRHTCTSSQSSTWEVKSLMVQEGEVEETPDTPDVPEDGVYIDETFANDFGVFSVNTVKGTPWIIDFSTAKASGYDNASGTTTPSESYLVSTPIDLSASEGATISFEYILRYVTNYGEPVPGVNNKVLVTDNYTGDPATTTWTDITGTLTEGRDWTTFEKYSAAMPTELIGKSNVVIALYYSCEDKSGTWEVKNLAVKEGDGESGGDQPGGGDISGNSITVDVSTLGLSNGEALETLTLADGTTLTFDGGGNTNTPKYYNTGTNIRMYPKNSMTINSKQTIVGVEMKCDEYSGTIYNASGDISTTSGTVSTNGNMLTVTGASANELTLTNTSTTTGAASQLRFISLTVYYAE